jgi:hypothetical protein
MTDAGGVHMSPVPVACIGGASRTAVDPVAARFDDMAEMDLGDLQ